MVTWHESAATDDYGSQGYTYTVRAAEAGEVTLYIENGNYSYENFTFEYSIHAVKPVALKEGNTFVQLYAGVYTPVTFKAEKTGVYTLSVDSNYTVHTGVYTYSEEYGYGYWLDGDYESSYRFVAKAGETVTLHINYAGSYANTPSITEKVSVATYEVANLSSLQLGENVCLATERGVTATFTAPKDGTYEFDDNSEYSMWFEGVTDGTSNKQIELTKGQSVTFIIKCDGLVTVTIQRNAPVLSFTLGTPVAVTIPAGETVALEEYLGSSDYQIVWDSSVENLVVTYGYQTLANGDTFTVTSSWYATALNFTNNGAEEVSFNVTVSEILPPPISLGENTVYVDDVFNGVYVSFTATEAGTYILKAAEGEEYASVSIKGQEYYPLNLPYMFTLTAGESIKFTVNTSNYEVYEDEISLVLTFEGESGGAVEPTVIQIEPDAGAQFVDIPANGSVILEMYVYGDYKVEWQAENLVVTFEGQPIANGSVINAESPRVATQLVLTTSDGAALSGKVIMVSPYVEPAPELVLGDNAINVPSGYDGVDVTFTATTAGKYVLSLAESEGNAYVMAVLDGSAEYAALPYEFTLAEGESFTFNISANDGSADEINLVLEKVPPATLTIAEALELGNTFEKDNYTTDKYYVSGKITSIANTTYGNMYIEDESGNKILIYGLYSEDGVRYDAMATKPGKNDTIKVLSVVGKYNEAQLKDAWLIEHTPAPEEPNTTTYTFSNYTAGTQYADEEHVLDDDITVKTYDAHFTTQIRLYDTTSHDSTAVIVSTKVITAASFNAGNSAATLKVYGSTDGETWTEIESFTTKKAYADYELELTNSENYTYLKLDAVGAQVRVASMTLTFAS